MMKVKIDGRIIQAEQGRSVLQTALDAGIDVPHFCYHKKLSVTAGCRMCMVDIDNMPRPVPACATPITDGMVIRTDTAQVKAARLAVMEFLLINHPLDCPVCDQGGECRLQDYAIAYGANKARYQETKRVIFAKNSGPLVLMQEMSRCIQCTRCVRFCQEIAGMMELGMMNRGENVEVTPFPEEWLHSELSGNLIDVCPVGALTSRPFRFSARGWELSSHRSISPHDSLGSNLIIQTLNGQVRRVLPADNDAINECWISDRDRFSYEALNSQDRLTHPMVKQGGKWIKTDWQTALSYIAHGLQHIASDYGSHALAALASPQATLEELFLLQKLMRALGTDKIEYRLRQQDTYLDGKVVPWLGMPIAAINQLDRILIIGSALRQELPLMAVRFRKAVENGAELSRIHAWDDNWLMPIAHQLLGAPVKWIILLEEIICAIAEQKKIPVPAGLPNKLPSHSASLIATSLLSGERKALFLGALALQHQKSSLIWRMAEWIAENTGATLGCFSLGANGVGGMIARAYPDSINELSMTQIASVESKAFLLLHTEPELEANNSPAMMSALKQAEMVVAMSPFRLALDYADVLLPISPFTETSGTYINIEGRVQSFKAAVPPLSDTRPAWKVLRVLGNFLGIKGFDFETSEEVRQACLTSIDLATQLNNHSGLPPIHDQSIIAPPFSRVGDVPALRADIIVRRASSLQKVNQSSIPKVYLPLQLFTALGIKEEEKVRVIQEEGEQILPAEIDRTLPEDVIRVISGYSDTMMLGPVDGWVRVERL